jgi:F0F1-type ATP synthase alpha subunit
MLVFMLISRVGSTAQIKAINQVLYKSKLKLAQIIAVTSFCTIHLCSQ